MPAILRSRGVAMEYLCVELLWHESGVQVRVCCEAVKQTNSGSCLAAMTVDKGKGIGDSGFDRVADHFMLFDRKIKGQVDMVADIAGR